MSARTASAMCLRREPIKYTRCLAEQMCRYMRTCSWIPAYALPSLHHEALLLKGLVSPTCSIIRQLPWSANSRQRCRCKTGRAAGADHGKVKISSHEATYIRKIQRKSRWGESQSNTDVEAGAATVAALRLYIFPVILGFIYCSTKSRP